MDNHNDGTSTIAFAMWDSVSGPTVVRTWPSPVVMPKLSSSDPHDTVRCIARNCLTAEIAHTSFGNRVNVHVFTMAEHGIVVYSLVFAAPVNCQADGTAHFLCNEAETDDSVKLFCWLFIFFDQTLSYVLSLRSALEETIRTKIFQLRAVIAGSQMPVTWTNVLDEQAGELKSLFATFCAVSMVEDCKFVSTSFGNDGVAVGVGEERGIYANDGASDDSGTNNGQFSFNFGWIVQSKALKNSAGMDSFLYRSIVACLLSKGRCLILGHSSKSINPLVRALSLLLPPRCRRLCRLAAARPGLVYIPGFYVQGVVGGRYPTKSELSMSPNLAICNTHTLSVVRTSAEHSATIIKAMNDAALVSQSFLRAKGAATTTNDVDAVSEIPDVALIDSIPSETIVLKFLQRLTLIKSTEARQRFLQAFVCNIYTRAFALIQLVQRSIESNSTVTKTNMTRKEIIKLLQLSKEGDLQVLVGTADLINPGFAERFDQSWS